MKYLNKLMLTIALLATGSLLQADRPCYYSPYTKIPGGARAWEFCNGIDIGNVTGSDGAQKCRTLNPGECRLQAVGSFGPGYYATKTTGRATSRPVSFPDEN